MLKKNLREQLRTTQSDTDLRQWFDPLSFDALEGDAVVVTFPHPLFSGWFGREQRTALEHALHTVAGNTATVSFRSPCPGSWQKNAIPEISTPTSAVSPSPGTPVSMPDKKKFSFEAFLYNKKNEIPLKLARELCSSSPTAVDAAKIPFLICGKGVCGKSHLLKAMAIAFSENSGCRVFFDNIAALPALYESCGPAALWHHLNTFDVLLFDDVQEISRHSTLQQEFIHFMDNCREQKKNLIVVVEDMNQASFSAKLRSRLEGGLLVALQKPDLDVRLRYVRKTAELHHIPLHQEQIFLLAQQYHDIRLLSGILTKFSALGSSYSAAHQNKSGQSMEKTAFQSILDHNSSSQNQPLYPERIMQSVAERFGVSPKDIAGAERGQDLVLARQISMYLCRKILGLSFPAIGLAFGGKNHATVVYSYKKIQQLRDNNNNINKLVSALYKKCQTAAQER